MLYVRFFGCLVNCESDCIAVDSRLMNACFWELCTAYSHRHLLSKLMQSQIISAYNAKFDTRYDPDWGLDAIEIEVLIRFYSVVRS